MHSKRRAAVAFACDDCSALWAASPETVTETEGGPTSAVVTYCPVCDDETLSEPVELFDPREVPVS